MIISPTIEEPTAIPAVAPLLRPDDLSLLPLVVEALVGVTAGSVGRTVVVLDVEEGMGSKMSTMHAPRPELQQVVLSEPQQ